MSLFGKILAILNFFGAIGLITVGLMDYSKRHTWAEAVFHQDLILQGLPLDTQDRTKDGKVVVELINDSLKKSLEQTLGPGVLTQKQEVERVEHDVNARLQGAPPEQVLARGAALLLPFAQTLSRYEQLQAYLAFLDANTDPDPKKNKYPKFREAVEQAWKEVLEQARKEARAAVAANPAKKESDALGEALAGKRDAFADALVRQALSRPRLEVALPLADSLFASLKSSPDEKSGLDAWLKQQDAQMHQEINQLFQRTRDDPSPRRAIAHLLFNIYSPLYGTPTSDLKRYATVVGLNMAAEPIYETAAATLRMASEVDKRERGRSHLVFAQEHGQLLSQIRDLARQVKADEDLKTSRTALQVEHEVQLKKRRAEVEAVEAELKKSRQETAQRLDDLRSLTASLYKIRIELRNATQDNQKLEKDIRALESSR